MTKKKYPSDILEQAIQMQDAWARIDEGLTVGEVNLGALVMEINHINTIQHSLVGLENQMTEMRNKRDALYESAWDKVRRVRAAIKGIYGFDSAQYELVGGTRASERKPVRRTAPAPVE